jgi:hypothetical protein
LTSTIPLSTFEEALGGGLVLRHDAAGYCANYETRQSPHRNTTTTSRGGADLG